MDQVKELSDQWVKDYNYHRPHHTLEGSSPMTYKKKTVEGLRSAPATPSLHSALQL
ncbi:integrase core domain-containing protein [Flavobacterium polysaccharolyticum]|uniref:integrase core domain-containing protein n=1 Tax=Flavobacterium polysaccharolyticum TaxID=3133148 RepID=UPI003CCBD95A